MLGHNTIRSHTRKIKKRLEEKSIPYSRKWLLIHSVNDGIRNTPIGPAAYYSFLTLKNRSYKEFFRTILIQHYSTFFIPVSICISLVGKRRLIRSWECVATSPGPCFITLLVIIYENSSIKNSSLLTLLHQYLPSFNGVEQKR